MSNRAAMLNAIGRRFIPGLVLRRATDAKEHPVVKERTTAYPCAAGTCRPPIGEVEALEKFLDEIERF